MRLSARQRPPCWRRRACLPDTVVVPALAVLDREEAPGSPIGGSAEARDPLDPPRSRFGCYDVQEHIGAARMRLVDQARSPDGVNFMWRISPHVLYNRFLQLPVRNIMGRWAGAVVSSFRQSPREVQPGAVPDSFADAEQRSFDLPVECSSLVLLATAPGCASSALRPCKREQRPTIRAAARRGPSRDSRGARPAHCRFSSSL